jgi:hypothetical protein
MLACALSRIDGRVIRGPKPERRKLLSKVHSILACS